MHTRTPPGAVGALVLLSLVMLCLLFAYNAAQRRAEEATSALAKVQSIVARAYVMTDDGRERDAGRFTAWLFAPALDPIDLRDLGACRPTREIGELPDRRPDEEFKSDPVHPSIEVRKSSARTF